MSKVKIHHLLFFSIKIRHQLTSVLCLQILKLSCVYESQHHEIHIPVTGSDKTSYQFDGKPINERMITSLYLFMVLSISFRKDSHCSLLWSIRFIKRDAIFPNVISSTAAQMGKCPPYASWWCLTNGKFLLCSTFFGIWRFLQTNAISTDTIVIYFFKNT